MSYSHLSRTIVLCSFDIGKFYTRRGDFGPVYVTLMAGDIDALWLSSHDALVISSDSENVYSEDGDHYEHRGRGRSPATWSTCSASAFMWLLHHYCMASGRELQRVTR